MDFDHLVVLVSQMAERASGAGDAAYDPLVVRENMQELFGTVGIWAPISPRVQRAMRNDLRYPPPHGESWTSIVDTKAWCAEPLRWRGATRRRPLVGGHGSRVGRPSRNWTVRRKGAMEPRAFLSSLDFFMHYPREDHIEESGRAPIEAMAAGVPVILPPAFQETFGAAALYAEPEAVWETIQDLWSDEQAYLARARGGRDFVLQHCGYDQFVKRLENLSEKNRQNLAASVG
jgi:hypothetical protein